MSKESYIRGFVKTAGENGVDPVQLAKYAARNMTKKERKEYERMMRDWAKANGVPRRERKRFIEEQSRKAENWRNEVYEAERRAEAKRKQDKADILNHLVNGTSVIGASSGSSKTNGAPAQVSAPAKK